MSTGFSLKWAHDEALECLQAMMEMVSVRDNRFSSSGYAAGKCTKPFYAHCVSKFQEAVDHLEGSFSRADNYCVGAPEGLAEARQDLVRARLRLSSSELVTACGVTRASAHDVVRKLATGFLDLLKTLGKDSITEENFHIWCTRVCKKWDRAELEVLQAKAEQESIKAIDAIGESKRPPRSLDPKPDAPKDLPQIVTGLRCLPKGVEEWVSAASRGARLLDEAIWLGAFPGQEHAALRGHAGGCWEFDANDWEINFWFLAIFHLAPELLKEHRLEQAIILAGGRIADLIDAEEARLRGADTSEQPAGKVEPGGGQKKTPASGGAELMPKQYLTSWREILDALDLKNDDYERQRVARENKKHGGPIKIGRKGAQPKVEKVKLIEWWNGLEIQWQDALNQKRGITAAAENQHPHGRTGQVAPEIGGSVKDRRKDREV